MSAESFINRLKAQQAQQAADAAESAAAAVRKQQDSVLALRQGVGFFQATDFPKIMEGLGAYFRGLGGDVVCSYNPYEDSTDGKIYRNSLHHHENRGFDGYHVEYEYLIFEKLYAKRDRQSLFDSLYFNYDDEHWGQGRQLKFSVIPDGTIGIETLERNQQHPFELVYRERSKLTYQQWFENPQLQEDELWKAYLTAPSMTINNPNYSPPIYFPSDG